MFIFGKRKEILKHYPKDVLVLMIEYYKLVEKVDNPIYFPSLFVQPDWAKKFKDLENKYPELLMFAENQQDAEENRKYMKTKALELVMKGDERGKRLREILEEIENVKL